CRDAAPGTMRPAGEPGAPPEGPGGQPLGTAEVPDVVRAGVDRAGAGWLRGEVDQRAAREREDRAEYERQSQAAHAESDRQIAEATAQARSEQVDARGGAAHEGGEQRNPGGGGDRKGQGTHGGKGATGRQKGETGNRHQGPRT